MSTPTRGFSRRTFLLGVGGGAASMSVVWGVSELGLPFLASAEAPPIADAFDAHAEYNGWLVTAEDKARMVLVELTDGWYSRETANGSSWRWTHQTATLSFLNPRARVVLHLDYDARAQWFESGPRTVTVTIRDQVIRSIVLDAAGRQRTSLLLPAATLGQQDRVEVQIAVDRTFVPANLVAGSSDTRELALQVYQVLVELTPSTSR